ncbi:hypothetical protein PIIN_03751 [Serendipita indica DSM 11827]|uniref:WD repeat-containing protein 75 second beta-propeller domain-containing protein n=1 Tax=Serendipita indica (strain DSM 11827) TaxID=1109443 RepID=G4TES0_SERID|nr:hypothetical protein PIIN_03751 [Serendipita indica DSM 11827]
MRATTGDKTEQSGKAAKRASRKGKAREEPLPRQESKLQGATAAAAAENDVQPWTWATLSNPQNSKQPPVFSKDGRYFFVPVSSSVKIYSSTTGKVLSTLKSHPRTLNGQSDRITCLMINPFNSFQLITGSEDGVLCIWDFITPALLRILDAGYPITHLCAHATIDEHLFVACRKLSKNGREESSIVMRLSLRITSSISPTVLQKASQTIVIGKARAVIGMGISASGKWLVVAGESKLYVASTAHLKAGFTKFSSTEKLTCFALHPTEDWLATGDSLGQIRFWYCLKDDMSNEKTADEVSTATTTLRWHAHAVQALEFTPNGAYLLSGGEEGVLVIWQIHTGKKEFVPRVGAPIKAISIYDTGDGTREQEYLLSLADGTLAFVKSSTLKLARSIARVKLEPPHQSRHSTHSPLAIHARSRNIFLLSSHPSSIQIYSPLSSSLLAELEVAPSNRVSRPYAAPLQPPRVELIAVSECGKWLATVDVRDETSEGFSIEIALKVWYWDETERIWDLNTKIDRPHGPNKLTSIAFSPSSKMQELLLATTGDDHNVKTWCLRATGRKEEDYAHWVLRSTFLYRNQRPTQATWSPDATVLAVGFGQFVTLWTVKTNTLFKSFSSAELSTVSRLSFAGRDGRYLCVVSNKALAVFNLLRGQASYVYESPESISGLFSWVGSDTFAISSGESQSDATKTSFLIFSVTSNRPTSQRTVPHLLREIVAWQPQRPDSESPLGFVSITNSGSLLFIGDIDFQRDDEAGSKLLESGEEERPSIFQDIFGKSAIVEQPASTTRSAPERVASLDQSVDWALLDGPSHLLPSIDALFDPLIDSLLRKQDSALPPAEKHHTLLDDDAQMDTAPDGTGPVRVKAREITQSEIDFFVELFRSSVFTASPSPLSPTSPSKAQPPLHVNGKSKVNGLTNGHITAKPPSPVMNGIHSRTPIKHSTDMRSSSPPPSLPTPTIGKKRKKALMS